MHFALVNSERSPPSPGLTGFCPVCQGPMIAKCGDQRVHHWAHRGKRPCDIWSEPETPWHRGWKNKFPDQWQEVIQFDAAGEKHIADVRTPLGLTIEFQHSALRPDERAAREEFYGNMFWVVDGSRLTRDLPRFLDGLRSFRTLGNGVHIAPFPDEAFPGSWLDCAAPVFFDFENARGRTQQASHVTDALWCLIPGRARGQAVVWAVSRESFVRATHDKADLIHAPTILGELARLLAKERR
jgi:competence protein CoiA